MPSAVTVKWKSIAIIATMAITITAAYRIKDPKFSKRSVKINQQTIEPDSTYNEDLEEMNSGDKGELRNIRRCQIPRQLQGDYRLIDPEVRAQQSYYENIRVNWDSFQAMDHPARGEPTNGSDFRGGKCVQTLKNINDGPVEEYKLAFREDDPNLAEMKKQLDRYDITQGQLSADIGDQMPRTKQDAGKPVVQQRCLFMHWLSNTVVVIRRPVKINVGRCPQGDGDNSGRAKREDAYVDYVYARNVLG